MMKPCLAKTANIVRRDMVKLEATFTGSFDLDCQVIDRQWSFLCFDVIVSVNIRSLACRDVVLQQLCYTCCYL